MAVVGYGWAIAFTASSPWSHVGQCLQTRQDVSRPGPVPKLGIVTNGASLRARWDPNVAPANRSGVQIAFFGVAGGGSGRSSLVDRLDVVSDETLHPLRQLLGR